MGVWGAGIFDSDTGLDIRDEFRDMMGDGISVDQAVAKLVEDYDPDDCEEEAAEFWLALAATQIETGRLSKQVKDRALDIIENETGLAAFARDCPDELPARKRAIRRLEKRILGAQKKPTKIKKAFVDTIEWEAGDGLAYQLRSGKWTGLKVREVIREPKHQEAFYEVMDIYQETMPTAEEMRGAGIRLSSITKRYLQEIEEKNWFLKRRQRKKQQTFFMGWSVFLLCRSGVRDQPGGKLVRVAQGLAWEKYGDNEGTVFGGWKDLDEFLGRDYGLK